MNLNKDYWENRYSKLALGWDIGYVSTPIKAYIDQLSNKELKILIPGAGYGHEVIYLFEHGFHNTFALDIAEQPLQHIQSQVPDIPKNQLVQGDFFNMPLADFDLVLEQTFFCSLPPAVRPDYVSKMHHLLKPGGILAGLLFDFPLTAQGPPFGGSKLAYTDLFSEHFKIKVLERAINSIPPRQGTELFFIFEK